LESYIDALQLTVIALAALLIVSVCFVGVIRAVQWAIEAAGRRRGDGRRGHTIEEIKKDKKKDIIIAAAVAGYLQAEQERKR